MIFGKKNRDFMKNFMFWHACEENHLPPYRKERSVIDML